MSRYIDADIAIQALWNALLAYEDKTEKQFLESDELDVWDWIQHRIYVQEMSDLDRQTILDMQTANVRENVPGVWAWHEDEDICNCSRCDFEIDAEGCIDPQGYVATYKFCPNCGAKMEVKQ